MEVARRPEHPLLRRFVRSVGYYEFGGPTVRERMLPTGAMQLLVNLDADEMHEYDGDRVLRFGGAVMQGARSHYCESDTDQQRAIAVVSFEPGGGFPFFAAPPAATAGHLVEIDALWGRPGAVLRERLLEAASPEAKLRVLEDVLLENAAEPPEPAIACAVATLERGAPVGEVADRLGLTTKTFTRRFHDRVGLTPKRYARVRRFQRALASVPHDRPPDWAEIAVSCGYYDQSHLIRDFHEFAGMSPTRYRPRAPHELNHVPV
ncbi:AraC family transcriptional regulator [Actinomadura craniellae]|uniref:AraC family transcriptional regulator n=1 Tax=Actinomadura craniellae TaxID=2231787 RepID=A0A365GZ95_9ACTN|nr:helix-turn-helix domain-containing protein [Actinomadura craniellae]RAY11263.1 AraC family transcriptional regulator [Actinomadura craniellae]